MSDATVWLTISSGFSLVLSFLLDIGLLVVALAFVRKRSGTAAWLLAAAAAVYMLSSIASPIAYAGIGRFVGVEEYVKLQAILNVSFTIVRSAAWVLMLVGIGKLASAGGPPSNRSALSPP